MVRPPTLALVLLSTPPGTGLLFSALVHAAAVSSVLTWLTHIETRRSTLPAHRDRDIADVQVLFLPALPPIESTAAAGDLDPATRPKADFAGPQAIVSDLPDATNSLQTIRRPNLTALPKLANPIRLQNMVALPAPVVALPFPRIEAQTPSTRQPLPETPTSDGRVELSTPSLVAPPVRSVVPQAPVVPASVATDPVEESKPIVVVDAISVPPDPAPVIPDAELSGRFVVAPLRDTSDGGAGPADTPDTVARSAAPERREISLPLEKGPSADSPPPASDRPVDARAGNGTASGILILGGNRERPSRGINTSSVSRGGAPGITIISGGTNGGATRDLGVFSRNDIVYTVYIPMADVGGGRDWPIEYALLDTASAGRGLLTPPVARKKVQATSPRSDSAGRSEPVFVTGIIDEGGRLHTLRAVRASDARAQSAIDALAKWEFLPAHLDGRAVATRVVIGVGVMPAEEAGKGNR
jgi:hypothetical protein